MLSGFLRDVPQTFFAWHYIDYLLDRDVEYLRRLWEMINDMIVWEFVDAEENLTRLLFLGFVSNLMDCLDDNRLVDVAFSIDSDGTLIMAALVNDTERLMQLKEQLYDSLPFIEEDEAEARAFVAVHGIFPD